MIYQELSRWIAQSESWQAFIDYNVPDDAKANYDFLNRQDDFYISLLSQLQEKLDNFLENDTDENNKDLLAIAKGLEIYSLQIKRESFSGVNYSRNMLYVASIYYLTNYSATSFLLLKPFRSEDFETEIERFIYYFLSRQYSRREGRANLYFKFILNFLRDGDPAELKNVTTEFESILKNDSDIDSHLFVLIYIARAILFKFSLNNLWSDLSDFGENSVWKSYIRFNLSKSPQIWSFFPSQQTAIKNGLLNFERAFSLQTPTSSGKTSIAELVIYNELIRNPESKILYLAPFRALASELKNNLGRNLSSKLGIKIKTIYGGNVVTESDRLSIEKSNVLISTPEKFMAIEVGLAGVLNEFRTIICDEGHLIDNKTRGISYELLLSRLKRSDIIKRRFVFLSAIIPNIEVINSWLGGSEKDIARSNYRPTEIELAFLQYIDSNRFDLEVNPQERIPRRYILNKFLSRLDFDLGNNAVYNLTSYKSKSVSSALKSLNSGAVAIFSPTKDIRQGVTGLASEIIKQKVTGLPKPIEFCDPKAVRDLDEYFQYVFSEHFLLVQSIRNGFLFHHGDLPQFIREIIENYIRNERVKLLICTTTLSEGVNLPIKTLIINSTRRFDKELKRVVPMSNRDLKNLIGRAGRAGKETKGTVIVTNPSDREIVLNVFANRNLEDVKGFLYHIVQLIERYIVRKATTLSNELLDQLEESDYIDDSIIQLLAEDITTEQLEEAVNTLIENTLTFYQSDEKLKTRLKELFSLRSERIKPSIENGEINIIRYSGIPLRVFSTIENKIDFAQDFLSEINDPLDKRWLVFLYDILFNMSTFLKAVPNDYSRDVIEKATNVWMNGGWYHDIAKSLGGSVENALTFCKFIEFSFQNAAASIIKYIELKRSESDKITSKVISQWTNYLVYGVKNELEIDLTEINIPDRITVLEISIWFLKNEYSYNDQDELRSILFANMPPLRNYLSSRIPKISLYSFDEYYMRDLL